MYRYTQHRQSARRAGAEAGRDPARGGGGEPRRRPQGRVRPRGPRSRPPHAGRRRRGRARGAGARDARLRTRLDADRHHVRPRRRRDAAAPSVDAGDRADARLVASRGAAVRPPVRRRAGHPRVRLRRRAWRGCRGQRATRHVGPGCGGVAPGPRRAPRRRADDPAEARGSGHHRRPREPSRSRHAPRRAARRVLPALPAHRLAAHGGAARVRGAAPLAPSAARSPRPEPVPRRGARNGRDPRDDRWRRAQRVPRRRAPQRGTAGRTADRRERQPLGPATGRRAAAADDRRGAARALPEPRAALARDHRGHGRRRRLGTPRAACTTCIGWV